MAEPIHISPRVTIPASALSVRAVRASGPGGQNVNKVATKIELTVDLDGIEGLNGGARRRLEAVAGRRLDSEGRLHVTCQSSREQHRNLGECRRRLRELVARALVAPRTRRPTRPSSASRERRLADKRRRAERKRQRGRVEREA